MKLADRESCSGCSACFAICPKRAITMLQDAEGFLRPVVNQELCVNCGMCERVCPSLVTRQEASVLACYAMKTRDRDLLMESSSGGAFTEIVRPVLARGGCVFGCIMVNPALVAVHAKTEDENGLAAMRGSKYVQSDVRDSFRECKKELDNGREVVFTGSPCQIVGLKNFLGKDYPNLLTIDFICHGVPSPAVFDAYKRDVERAAGTSLNRIASRNKHYSWKRSCLALGFTDAKQNRVEPLGENPFFKAFIRNFCLRPSCYSCKTKSAVGAADITISDFWGIESAYPEFADRFGVSAVIVHSQHGERAVSATLDKVEFIKVNLHEVLRSNPSYASGVRVPTRRNRFMRICRKHGFSRAFDVCCRIPLWRRIAGKCYRFLKGRVGL